MEEELITLNKQVTFMQAGRILKEKKFSFSGRSSRSEYWLGLLWLQLLQGVFMLGWVFIFGISNIFAILIGVNSPGDNTIKIVDGMGSWPPIILILIIIFCWLIISLLGLALTARRLHDIGKSGWWQLLNLVPWIGALSLLIVTIGISVPDNEYGSQPPETL